MRTRHTRFKRKNKTVNDEQSLFNIVLDLFTRPWVVNIVYILLWIWCLPRFGIRAYIKYMSSRRRKKIANQYQGQQNADIKTF